MRRTDGKDRASAIMDVVEKLFTSRRFHEITLDDIVAGAAIGKGTIYRYFRNKEDLFFRTAARGFDELCELLGRRVPAGVPFDQKILTACRLIDRFFRRRHQLFRMMQSEEARIRWCREELRRRWSHRRKQLVSAVARIIESGVREGAIRSDVPPDVLAAFLLGMLRTRFRHLDDAAGRRPSLGFVVGLFCGGAQAAPSAKAV
jgi:AcrR family transcriptional regulator